MKKVILIMSFSTQDSEYENQPLPEFCWTNAQGGMLGIWDLEFSDIMLKRLVTCFEEYDCEIWQPELRADKVYSAQLHERLIHRKYPSIMLKGAKRLRSILNIYSREILSDVQKHDNDQTIFMLPAAVYNRWLDEMISSIQKARILYYHMLNNGVLLPTSAQTLNPFKVVNRVLINWEKSKWIMRIQALLTPNTNPGALAWLRKHYPGLAIYELKWGLDHEFWQVVMRKDEARAKLGISPDQYVIVLSQRLVPEYQLDKFIEAVSGIRAAKPFTCFITGHGTQDYERYLQCLVDKHNLQSVINFAGFVSDENLRTYLIAADLFATFPIASAGSGGALKAMAVGTPVLLTTSCGESYHFLREHEAGEYVEPTDYSGWVRKLGLLIDGLAVKTVSRAEVLARYDDRFTADSLNSALRHWD